MRRMVERDDLSWAGYLLLLSIAFGLLYHWPLVRIAWQGELVAHLDKKLTERRAVEFKGVKQVSLKEAHDLWKEGQTLFLDARSPEDYAELRIPGSVNLPPEKLEDLKDSGIPGLPRDRQILIYCSKERCDASFKVAKHLQSLGFTRVVVFLEGFQAWDEAGYEADSSR